MPQIPIPPPIDLLPARRATLASPPGDCGRSRFSGEGGFTLIEVLVACLVLVVGLLALFGALNVAAHTTSTNRQRQAETNLARELIEDARTLDYSQLTPATLAGALQPLIAGSTVSGQTLSLTRSGYPMTVSLDACSLDDPSDGYGDHSSAPVSGGTWCTNLTGSGAADDHPDDEKRLSVAVAPQAGIQPVVKLRALISNNGGNRPAVSAVSCASSVDCPTVTNATTSSVTFTVTTTTQAASIEWLVNGNPPASAQLAGTGTDPYHPSSTTSTFTWTLPAADGTYLISAYAQNAEGNTGSRSTLQVTVNRHDAIPPANVLAGYDPQIGGVDIQWSPSLDQDVIGYDVYRQAGSDAAAVMVCNQVTGTTCTDTPVASPGSPSGACATPRTDYAGQPSFYWVVGVDADPSGAARVSTQASSKSDANLCDNPPSPPTNLTVAPISNGALTLSWSAPAAPQDLDPGDSIQGWRIYRWADGAAQTRLAYVGATSAGQPVTSFTDSSPDPNSVTQNYCVTSVDTRLSESTCSAPVHG